MRRHGLSGTLRLAAIPAALVWTAGLAAALSRRHPDIRITLLSRGPRDLLQMLQDFEIDAGINYLDDAPAGRVETRPLCRERHALLCPPSSPFARRAALCWKDLDGAPLALLTPGMQDRRIIDRLLAEGGARPRICLESDSVTALAARVAEGGCVAVLPAGIARLLAGGDRLAQVPIGGGGRVRPVGMLLPRRDPRPPLLAALVTEAQGLAELAGAW